MKSPDNPKQWIIDEAVADNVRYIFRLCLDGRKKVQIDIEFAAVGLISIPNEKELLSLMDEIRNEKSA